MERFVAVLADKRGRFPALVPEVAHEVVLVKVASGALGTNKFL
jgi:hypothetical protein